MFLLFKEIYAKHGTNPSSPVFPGVWQGKQSGMEKMDMNKIKAIAVSLVFFAVTACESESFKTVKIGEQTWMAENLNIEMGNSKCYDNNPANCQKYGRLYDWNTALNVCPKGWHLPSNADWNVLMKFVNSRCSDNINCASAGKKLKAASGWSSNGNGEDSYGFSALPGGGCYSYGTFANVGNSGYWWSASEHDSDLADNRDMSYSSERVYRGYGSKDFLYSVRCVKDD